MCDNGRGDNFRLDATASVGENSDSVSGKFASTPSWGGPFRRGPERIGPLQGAMYPSVGVVLIDLYATTCIPQLVSESIGYRLDEGTWFSANPVILWTNGRPPSLAAVSTRRTFLLDNV